MKILWFTNTSCSLSKKINPKNVAEGWTVSLENHINKSPDVELFISFYQNKPSKPIKYGNTTYYPVLRKFRFINKIKYRLLNYAAEDELELQRLLKVIEKVNPDIIHIHGTENNFGLIQKFVSQPVVISIQSIINPYLEKYFSGIPWNIIKKYEFFKPKLYISSFSQKKRYYQFKAMAQRELKILKLSRHIIGRTNWDRRITSILSPDGNYYHVDELIRDDFFSSIWNGDNIPSKEFKIITLASGPVYKGLETIIKTASILNNIQDLKFSWDIIGIAEQDPVAKIIKTWLNININKINIILHGKLPPEKFIPLMLSSDVYCQASHIENSPNSLCEAMCLGMPIVATFAGGTESMLENNREGILIQDGDPYSMAGALIELKNNPLKSKEMAKNARERALSRHNPQKVVRDLLTIYRKILLG